MEHRKYEICDNQYKSVNRLSASYIFIDKYLKDRWTEKETIRTYSAHVGSTRFVVVKVNKTLERPRVLTDFWNPAPKGISNRWLIFRDDVLLKDFVVDWADPNYEAGGLIQAAKEEDKTILYFENDNGIEGSIQYGISP